MSSHELNLSTVTVKIALAGNMRSGWIGLDWIGLDWIVATGVGMLNILIL